MPLRTSRSGRPEPRPVPRRYGHKNASEGPSIRPCHNMLHRSPFRPRRRFCSPRSDEHLSKHRPTLGNPPLWGRPRPSWFTGGGLGGTGAPAWAQRRNASAGATKGRAGHLPANRRRHLGAVRRARLVVALRGDPETATTASDGQPFPGAWQRSNVERRCNRRRPGAARAAP